MVELTVESGGKRYSDGVLKKTYWTPDGRKIRTPPAMRTYINRETGEEGIRDANYDKGWLEQQPQNPKPHCPGCDRWHDTEEEVKACIEKNKKFSRYWDKKAKKQQEEDIGDRVDKLEDDISEIKDMLKKVLNG